MKSFLILCLVSSVYISQSCTPIFYNYETINLTEVVSVDSTNANRLFVMSNSWMVEKFSIIQYSDKEAGIIKGKYNLYYRASKHGSIFNESISEISINAIITIDVKSNMAKINIRPIRNSTVYSIGLGYTMEQANKDVKALANNFKLYLKENQKSTW